MEKHRSVKVDNQFTVNALNRLGVEWPMTELDYIKKLLLSVSSLGGFD